MSLTPKQEKFAQCIADGLSQADAYRAAYNADDMKADTIYVKASELMSDGKVSVRVKELRGKLENKALWTREMSVKGLVQAYKVGQQANSAAGMTGAIKELNAMHGYSITRHELTGKDGAPIKHDANVKLNAELSDEKIKEELEKRGIRLQAIGLCD